MIIDVDHVVYCLTYVVVQSWRHTLNRSAWHQTRTIYAHGANSSRMRKLKVGEGMDPQLQARAGQDNRDTAVGAGRGDGHDVFLTVYSFLSSPRVTTFLKWTVISGVSVGVCTVVVHYYIKYQGRALHDALKFN